MKKITLFGTITIIFCLSYCYFPSSAINNYNNDQFYFKKPEKKAEKKTDKKAEKKTDKKKKAKTEKPEYYASLKKVEGWLIGFNKLESLEKEKRLGCYYKFSRKNKAGKWTFVEAFDGYGDPISPEDYVTYLVDPNDEDDNGVNPEWKEKLKNVCKWSFLTDDSGKTVVKEIALDANGDTIFIFTPTKIRDREYVGSYTDTRGLPIYLRTDGYGNHKYSASKVIITRNEKGYDEYVKFIDDNGFPQKNKDGEYIIQKKYDNKGRQTSEISLHFSGTPINNNKYFCEWRGKYDNDKYDEHLFYDTKGKPTLALFDDLFSFVFGYRLYYDEYGRDTTIIIVDSIGKPDVDLNGVHKISKKYNDYGQIIRLANYDSIGKPCGGAHGVAQTIYTYDGNGNIVIKEYKDKDNKYVIGEGNFCKEVIEYENNTIIVRTNYRPLFNRYYLRDTSFIGMNSNDSIVKSYEYRLDHNGKTTRKWFTKKNKGYQRIDSVDSYQRHTLTAWYDLEGHPINDVDTVMLIDKDDSYLYDSSIIDNKKEYHGFHKKTIKYDDKNGIMTIQLFNKNGGPAYDEDDYYSKATTVINSINHTDTTYYYIDSSISHIFVSHYDSVTGDPVRQYDLTPYKEHVRYFDKNIIHYQLCALYNVSGEQIAVYGENEFGEPSYIYMPTENDEKVFYYIDLQNSSYYDENNFEIPINQMADHIKDLPKAFCIEMTDTTNVAYQCGLRNGDIIVSFGDWTVSKDLMSNLDEFYLETILKADTTKTIKLLRHHPEKKSSEIVSCELPKGKISDLGFYPQKIYYTRKEANRLKGTCETYHIPLSYSFNNGDTTILLAVQKKGSPDRTPLYYNSTNKDAGILLYAESNDDIWSVRKTIPIDNKTGEIQFSPDYIYLTHDLNDLTLISEYDHHGGLEIVPIKVNKSLYERILDFYDIHSKQIPFDYCLVVYRTKKDPAIIDNKLRGKWNMVAKLGYFKTVDMTVKLNKGNRAELDIRLVKESSYARVEYAYRATPKWTLNGVCIEFDFSNANAECEITQLDYDSDVSWIKNAAENIRHKLIEDINTIPLFIENCLIVNGLSKDDMTVTDGNKEYVFKKVK
ncbi:MAG: hypothetical protein IJK41_09460 [Muribaculaceae bacterium]|nr:hypothetical protein [Muribaculaceae bacterium]